MSHIPLLQPELTGLELDHLRDALDSGWITTQGPFVDGLETELCERTGRQHALATSTGTAALHLALCVLGVGPGDYVICPTFTFAATAFPILYQNATPLFVDCDPATWQIDPELVERGLLDMRRRGKRVAAVIAADVYGQCADYDRLEAICARHGVPMIADAAQSLGATYRDRPAGALGTLAVLSFNGSKIVTGSTGGALLGDDEALLARGRHLAHQAREPGPRYSHTELGFNYRMSNLVAAVVAAQLPALAERVDRKREIAESYAAAVADVPGVEFMPEAAYGRSSRWLSCITIAAESRGPTSSQVQAALNAVDIESRFLWTPLHHQPAFAGSEILGGSECERLAEDGLCLPSGAALTSAQLETVSGALRVALS